MMRKIRLGVFNGVSGGIYNMHTADLHFIGSGHVDAIDVNDCEIIISYSGICTRFDRRTVEIAFGPDYEDAPNFKYDMKDLVSVSFDSDIAKIPYKFVIDKRIFVMVDARTGKRLDCRTDDVVALKGFDVSDMEGKHIGHIRVMGNSCFMKDDCHTKLIDGLRVGNMNELSKVAERMEISNKAKTLECRLV